VLELVRRNARFFLWAGLVAVGLRVLAVLYFPGVVDDSRLYADIARNWLQHGIYGVTDSGDVVPTLSRLPGYPAFLAAIFAVFRTENFRAVLLAQVLVDLASCFLIADLSRRLLSARAARAAFILAAICPFLINYAAAALTETFEIFFTVLAFDLAVCGLGLNADEPETASFAQRPRRGRWLACGLAIGGAILLRPDGGILLAAIGGYLLVLMFAGLRSRSQEKRSSVGPIVRAGILLAVGVTACLAPWTIRNFRTLHRFQPLAPRYANDSDELVMTGFNRWVKTWMAEYVSVQEIYWNVPGESIDAAHLPIRAFDSVGQRDETIALFAEYNKDREITPELDTRFAALAATRIRTSPIRYYVKLPAMRIADMWLRPRTELLPSDPRWWEFNDDGRWLTVSIVFGLVNLAYILMAAWGLLRARGIFGVGLFVLFLLLRSGFLGTLENPEPRYTLECYPVLIFLASALVA
jgi:4-amino-4-deoxy-L-arabinose transferase-like glycosyltransferase